MRVMLFGLLALGLVLAGFNQYRADEAADIQALFAKATKAGGGDKLKKLKITTWKAKGAITENNVEINFTLDGSLSGLDKSRTEFEIDVMGQKMGAAVIVNGDQGWMKSMDQVMDAPKEVLDILKQLVYGARLAQMQVSLKDKEFKLSTLGESKINDKDSLGVKVNHKDHADVDVYFDKDTGLPNKVETRITEPGGKERTLEFFFTEYKEFEGFKHWTKITLHQDGKKLMDAEITEIKPQEKLDDNVFAKP